MFWWFLVGSSTKKITGKAGVGFVSDKQRSHLSKVKATTASIPLEVRYGQPAPAAVGEASALTKEQSQGESAV